MNMLVSALTTSGKLTICLIFLLVILALEVFAFVGLFMWRKKALKSPNANVAQQPVNTSDQPSEPQAETAEQSVETAQQSTETTEQPVETAEQPTETAEQSAEIAEQPTDTTQQPAEQVEQPTDTAQQPVETAEQPTETTEQPIEVAEQPVEAVEQSIEIAEQPAEAVEQSTEVIEQPVETAKKPVKKTIKVVKKVVKTADGQVISSEEEHSEEILSADSDKPVKKTVKTVKKVVKKSVTGSAVTADDSDGANGASDTKKDEKSGTFAFFAPLALLSSASGASSLRGAVYAFAIICMLLAVGAMAVAVVFALKISKKKQEAVEQPVEEPAPEPQPQPEPEPVEEPTPEPVEEVVEPEPEPQPEPEPEPEPQPQLEEVITEEIVVTTVEEEEEEEDDEEEESRIFVETDDGGYFIILEKTFTARLIQSKSQVKDYYSQIKNALLSFKKVSARMSKKRESFRSGRATIARMMIRGKTLRLYLALDPANYVDAKYKVEDKSYVATHSDCSLMLRVNSERKCEFAIELIEDLAANFNLIPDNKFEDVDYVAQLPFESTDELVEKGLIVKKLAKGTSLFDSKVVDVLSSSDDDQDTHVNVDSDPISDEDGDIADLYERSFTAKLMQSDVSVKQFYSQLKNHLLSYGKVNARMTKKREVFRFGKVVVARMSLRSKTLRLYLALDFDKFKDGKYLIEDASSVKAVEDTPVLYRIANERRSRFAKELIDEMLKALGAEQGERTDIDYTAELPYKTDEELFHQGLIVIKNVEGITDKK